MTVFFTADTHFGHANIIRYCRRPFSSVAEMDQALIASWNARVRAGDEVWHLGDFCWYRDGRCAGVWWRLNGRKFAVLGNHDLENPQVLQLPWAEPPEKYKMISCEGQAVFLCHYPMRSWPGIGKGAIHLYGHVHGRLPDTRQCLDVGVDCWNFVPVTLGEISARLKQRSKLPEQARTQPPQQPPEMLDKLTARFDEHLGSLQDPQTRKKVDRVFVARGRLRKKPKWD